MRPVAAVALIDRGYQNCIPSVVPGWANTARTGRNGLVLMDSQPHLYAKWLAAACRQVQTTASGPGLVFVNAWNEWAEGNHLEPDRENGAAYLETTASVLASLQEAPGAF